ncbi:MAG: MAPEG family protein [Robiginitomaculum sp.]|nr:MAPEG family protein [Robiginitomaculum sp.]
MTLFEIAALYIAINILILFTLTYLVIRQRNNEKIIFGDGDSESMQRAIRVHGNFTEYAPMALIGIFAMAGLSASPYWLHGVGIAFTTGRILHAFGYTKTTGESKGRFIGMILTGLSLLTIAGYLLFSVVI